jgi:hypothetical protein
VSAAQYAAAFACIILAFLAGHALGQRAEKKRAAALISFAAWVFHQLWITPEHEWRRLDLRRRDGRYDAIFHHDYEVSGRPATHTNYFKGDLT